MDVAFKRMERILDVVYKRWKNDKNIRESLSNEVWSNSEIVKNRDSLEADLRSAGYDGEKLSESKAFTDMLIVHGLECGKTFTLFSIKRASELKKSEKDKIRSKDDLSKSVEQNDVENLIHSVLDNPLFVKEYDIANVDMHSKGCMKDLKDMTHYEICMRSHGITFSNVYLDKVMKTNVIEQLKRMIR
jgi:hypothetical protein